jgi:uncharacterized protein with von Willebrand factor type A (vWA) domain
MKCYKIPRWTQLNIKEYQEIEGNLVTDVAMARFPGIEVFCGEVFHRLFDRPTRRYNLKTRRFEERWETKIPSDKIKLEDQIWEFMHSELESNEAFQEMYAKIRGNIMMCGETAVNIVAGILDQMPEPEKGKLDNIDEHRNIIEQMKEKGADKNDSEFQQALANGKAERAAWGEYLKAGKDQLAKGVKAIAKRIEKGIDEKLEQQKVFCDPDKASMEEQIKVAKKLQFNSKLRKIAKQAGKYKESARRVQRRKKVKGHEEFVDIGMGNHLPSVVSFEILKLFYAPQLFALGYAEKTLTQREFESPNTLDRGPMVICLDQSSSMSDDRDIWAKAITIVLIEIAAHQKRNAYVIPFDHNPKEPIVLKKGKSGSEAILEMCQSKVSGSTDFYGVLLASFDVIKTNKDFKEADILFITDGEDDLPDIALLEIARKKIEYDTKITGLLIHQAEGKSLEGFCDEIIAFKDLSDEKLMEQVFNV